MIRINRGKAILIFLYLASFTLIYSYLPYQPIFSFISLSTFICPYLSLSNLKGTLYPYHSLSILIYPYLPFSILKNPNISLSLLIYSYLTIFKYPNLSLSSFICPYQFLSIPILVTLFYPYLPLFILI